MCREEIRTLVIHIDLPFKTIWRDHILVYNSKSGGMKDCKALNGSGYDGDLHNSLYLQSGSSYLSASIGRQIWQPSDSTVIWEEKGWIWTTAKLVLTSESERFYLTYLQVPLCTLSPAAIMCVPSVLVMRAWKPLSCIKSELLNSVDCSHYIQEKWWRK